MAILGVETNKPARIERRPMKVLERYEPLIDELDTFYAACQRSLPSVVRVNTIKATIEQAKIALDEEGIFYEQADWNPEILVFPDDQPGANWPYVHGWLHGQEEVSAVPAMVIDPEPGERVWDACAAPGSKTTQLAAMMNDEGVVVATDNNLGRLSSLRSNTERLGVTNVAVTNEDARNHSLKPFDGTLYDHALVDVPCSCEGTVRKNPDVLEEWTYEHVKAIVGVQKGILRRAIQATRPGGTVVYSTCTFAPEENEEVLSYALEKEPCEMVPIELPLESTDGITEWDEQEYNPAVKQAKRIYPHYNDTGGFFCAKLEVTES